MNWTGWVPIAALVPAVIAAMYPVIRDRAGLPRAEQITRIIKDASASDAPLEVGELTTLQAMRTTAIESAAQRWAATDRRRPLWRGIGSLTFAIVIGGSQFLPGSVTPHWLQIVAIVEILVIVPLGCIDLARYRRDMRSDQRRLRDLVRHRLREPGASEDA